MEALPSQSVNPDCSVKSSFTPCTRVVPLPIRPVPFLRFGACNVFEISCQQSPLCETTGNLLADNACRNMHLHLNTFGPLVEHDEITTSPIPPPYQLLALVSLLLSEVFFVAPLADWVSGNLSALHLGLCSPAPVNEPIFTLCSTHQTETTPLRDYGCRPCSNGSGWVSNSINDIATVFSRA